MNLPRIGSRYASRDGRYLTVVGSSATYRKRFDGKAQIRIYFAAGARKTELGDLFKGSFAKFRREFKKVDA